MKNNNVNRNESMSVNTHEKSNNGLMKTLAIILGTVALVTLCAAGTAFLTYRAVMESITVETEGDIAYLTVFGQTDEYAIEK